jgi:hypothetical protein
VRGWWECSEILLRASASLIQCALSTTVDLSAFHLAAESGNLESWHRFLAVVGPCAKHMELDGCNGLSPLHVACILGHLDVVEALLPTSTPEQMRQRYVPTGDTAAHFLAAWRPVGELAADTASRIASVITQLSAPRHERDAEMSPGASLAAMLDAASESPLHRMHPDVVRHLTLHDSDGNTIALRDALTQGTSDSDSAVQHAMLRGEGAAMLQAVMRGTADGLEHTVAQLLQYRCRAMGRSLMHFAVAANDADAVRQLLVHAAESSASDAGADVASDELTSIRSLCRYAAQQDTDAGMPALHLAAGAHDDCRDGVTALLKVIVQAVLQFDAATIGSIEGVDRLQASVGNVFLQPSGASDTSIAMQAVHGEFGADVLELMYSAATAIDYHLDQLRAALSTPKAAAQSTPKALNHSQSLSHSPKSTPASITATTMTDVFDREAAADLTALWQADMLPTTSSAPLRDIALCARVRFNQRDPIAPGRIRERLIAPAALARACAFGQHRIALAIIAMGTAEGIPSWLAWRDAATGDSCLHLTARSASRSIATAMIRALCEARLLPPSSPSNVVEAAERMRRNREMSVRERDARVDEFIGSTNHAGQLAADVAAANGDHQDFWRELRGTSSPIALAL